MIVSLPYKLNLNYLIKRALHGPVIRHRTVWHVTMHSRSRCIQNEWSMAGWIGALKSARSPLVCHSNGMPGRRQSTYRSVCEFMPNLVTEITHSDIMANWTTFRWLLRQFNWIYDICPPFAIRFCGGDLLILWPFVRLTVTHAICVLLLFTILPVVIRLLGCELRTKPMRSSNGFKGQNMLDNYNINVI